MGRRHEKHVSRHETPPAHPADDRVAHSAGTADVSPVDVGVLSVSPVVLALHISLAVTVVTLLLTGWPPEAHKRGDTECHCMKDQSRVGQ